MSTKSDCPACTMGNHEGHNKDWNIRPGLIGGSSCGCTGDCQEKSKSITRRLGIMLGKPE